MKSWHSRSAWVENIPGKRFAPDALAVIVTACALVVWWLLFRSTNTSPSVTLLIAAAVSTWFGGIRCGILSTTVGVLADVYFYVLPRLTPALAVPHTLRLLTFVGFAAAVLLAVRRLRRTQQMLHAVICASPLPIFTTDTAGRITSWNPAAEGLLGWRANEVMGKPLPTVPSERQPEYRTLLSRCLQGESVIGVEVRRQRKDGGDLDLCVAAAPLTGVGGQVTGVLCIYSDMTERKEAEEALREGREQIKSSFENSVIGIAVSRVDGTFLDVNPALCRLLGCTRDELLLMSFRDLTYADDAPETNEQHQRVVAGERSSVALEKRYVHKDGHAIWCLVDAALVRGADGQPHHFITQIQDITERKKYQDQLRHQALHDALTGLPNRVLLHDRLEQATRVADRDPAPFALLLIDVDRFKNVNDTLGHDTGDRLLQEVASRLSKTVRKSDTVARLGGDEFAIILPGSGGTDAMRIAHMVGRVMRLPVTIDGYRIDIAASIGISLYPDDGADGGTLLRHADLAMYDAKRAGGMEVLYRPNQELSHPGDWELTADLPIAVEQDQLLLEYQPIANLHTGCADHVEALVRWNHPEYGLIPPSEFIPLAEKIGLIEPLTFWVLKTALHQSRDWQRAEHDISVAVNLSARSLQDVHLPDTVGWLLRQSAVSATSLTLEITESALMSDPEQAAIVLQRLHEMGVLIAIDDFGIGYSSLSYVEQLPIDVIKIDRSFVSTMTHERSVIVRSVIDLARDLGLQVTAEGVETLETWEQLADMGCTMAQGYFLSPPVPAAALTQWVRTRTGSMESG